VQNEVTPAALDRDLLLRKLAVSHVMLNFFNDVDVSSDDPRIAAAQYFGTKGFFAGYDATLDEPLTEAVKDVWQEGFEKLKQGTLEPMQLARAVRAAEAQPSQATDHTRGEFLLVGFARLAQVR